MPDPKITREWLSKAQEDLAFASACLGEEMSFFAQICFFFQQSAEKYLKGYIAAKNLSFRKVHDLIELLEICKKENPGFTALESACKFLNRFYMDTRYPAHWPSDFIREDALEAQKSAQLIAQWIQKQLTEKP